jgi:hypothetical protein
MWTPKRVILLVAGIAVFLTGFEVYAYFLGGIDGLPPLPASYAPGPGTSLPGPLPPPKESDSDRKLRQAFGPECEEVRRPIKLDVRSRRMVLATNEVNIGEEPDGRVRLTGFSLAVWNESGNATFPEINTIKSDLAFLTFDKPVKTPMEMTNSKIVACELRNNIKLVNNRHTPEKSDDIEVRILTNDTPLFYDDKQNKIWTKGLVQLLDTQTKPQPTMIWACGLDLYLSRDNGKAVAKPGTAPARPKSDTVSGVDVVELHSNVVMYLWDSGSGLLSNGDKDQKAAAGKAKTDSRGSAKVGDGLRIQVKITTNGPVRYFVARDLASFESPAVASRDPGELVLEDRVVVQRVHQVLLPADVAGATGNLFLALQLNPLGEAARICSVSAFPDRILLDTITCDRLELQFRRKANADPGAARSDQSSQKEIETAYASARPGQEVVLIAQKEALEAHGKELIYFAATAERGPQTVIKGDAGQPMIALKDNNRIKAVELHMVGADRKGEGQRAYAKGPGRIDLWDKKTQSYPDHAVWSGALTTIKEQEGNRVYDLLTFEGDAAFVDDEHNQEMRAQRLQVWLEPADRAAAADTDGSPKEPSASSGQRPHKLEAFDHVRTRSPDLRIHDCEHLIVRFKDAPPPSAPAGASPVAPAASPQTNPNSPDKGSEAKQNTTAANQQKKVIDLWGRSVAAYVLRTGARNDLQEVVTEGAVHVHQDGSNPGDKGVDIKGETLNLVHHADGDTLIVFGDSRRPNDLPAQLQFGELFLAGPKVTINQKDNTAEVVGCGVMTMPPGNATFEGGKPAKPGTRLTIHWNQYMLFESKVANFHGGVFAYQDEGSLRSEALEVTLDRPVSFKEGQKGGQQPKVEKMVASMKVYVKDSTYDKDNPKKLIRYHRLVARNLEADNEKGPIRASGPGSVYLLQFGSADQSATTPAKTTQATQPKPAPGEQRMTLTRIDFTGHMYSNTNDNEKVRITKFRDNVEVFHQPADNPDVKIDPDHPPKDGLYLRCAQLEVRTVTLPDGKSNQLMQAEQSVSFRTPEFYGTADVVKYDESLERIIFEGTGGNYARLYQFNGQGAGAPPREITGKQILYERKTGRLYGGDVKSILMNDVNGGR